MPPKAAKGPNNEALSSLQPLPHVASQQAEDNHCVHSIEFFNDQNVILSTFADPQFEAALYPQGFLPNVQAINCLAPNGNNAPLYHELFCDPAYQHSANSCFALPTSKAFARLPELAQYLAERDQLVRDKVDFNELRKLPLPVLRSLAAKRIAQAEWLKAEHEIETKRGERLRIFDPASEPVQTAELDEGNRDACFIGAEYADTSPPRTTNVFGHPEASEALVGQDLFGFPSPSPNNFGNSPSKFLLDTIWGNLMSPNSLEKTQRSSLQSGAACLGNELRGDFENLYPLSMQKNHRHPLTESNHNQALNLNPYPVEGFLYYTAMPQGQQANVPTCGS